MRYHAHMKFRIKGGQYAGVVGEIAATDFELNTTDLLMPNGFIVEFRNDDVELHDHDECDAPACITNRKLLNAI